ncbi:MAG: hypothetical protein F2903_09175 [Actinobacteria bacterium]|jgi:predicted nucleotidyltransferase|uniref:Unannotated protein n=1 Tax=freshwater metagenome TaxID=449393 RepID=A0A6J7A804_9ZZZZ|nr:hypothetical protein [Actinomycetota bacterium]MSX10431.1 hypothetical protein [Actinomycetota bacterium]MSX68235.1 hypothetical protein [Actinomycetota bacterium]
MDLSRPIASVMPNGHGAVLAVLARTDEGLSGRRISELTQGGLSQKGTNNILTELVDSGIALCQDAPPAKLYRLNRKHLAANAIVVLSHLRRRLFQAIGNSISLWKIKPQEVWVFGSAARGDGSTKSDIDIAIIRSDGIDSDDETWNSQLHLLSEDVLGWSGNHASILQYTVSEFSKLRTNGERVFEEILQDGVKISLRPSEDLFESAI